MAIERDGKDWTWVLEKPCDECGFDPSTVLRINLASRVRAAAEAIRTAVLSDSATIRPNDHTWSPLEYGAHVRDVCTIMRKRQQLMLDADDPEFDNWDQDATAIEQRYNEQDQEQVAHELAVAASDYASAIDAMPAAALERTGRRSNGSRFTAFSLAVYALHDLEHHAWDVAVARY